jgi:nucleoporin NUP82
VAKVRWHPHGANDSTLLVLTADGLLREYDVSEDAEEPTQVVDFCADGSKPPSFAKSGFGLSRSHNLQKSSSARSGLAGWSADDVDGTIATSFCLGQGKADWGPLTLYCLMRNGDIYAVCPYVPKNA